MSALYDGSWYPNDESIASIKPGMIIAYRLLPKDMPTNPSKTWRGKVVHCDKENILVEMLEPGYVGLTEVIRYEQIVGLS